MTTQLILSDIAAVIDTYLGDNNLTSTDTLTDTQNVEVTDLIAAKLETVNPDHTYPPVKK